jgi:hypothetical protein
MMGPGPGGSSNIVLGVNAHYAVSSNHRSGRNRREEAGTFRSIVWNPLFPGLVEAQIVLLPVIPTTLKRFQLRFLYWIGLYSPRFYVRINGLRESVR